VLPIERGFTSSKRLNSYGPISFCFISSRILAMKFNATIWMMHHILFHDLVWNKNPYSSLDKSMAVSLWLYVLCHRISRKLNGSKNFDLNERNTELCKNSEIIFPNAPFCRWKDLIKIWQWQSRSGVSWIPSMFAFCSNEMNISMNYLMNYI
jgi:hypothetical protein